LKKYVVVRLKGLGGKTNWWAVNRQLQSNSEPDSVIKSPRGGGIEYLHRSPANRRRRRNGDPVLEGINGPPCSWEISIRVPGPPGWGGGLESEWDSKIWSWVPQDLEPRMTALARASRNCKRQTHPLVRVDVPHQQTRNCLRLTKIWPWYADGRLTARQIGHAKLLFKVRVLIISVLPFRLLSVSRPESTETQRTCILSTEMDKQICFVCVRCKITCSLGCATISTIKTHNVERHFRINHKDFYTNFPLKGEGRVCDPKSELLF
jgi:hypothetical protein